MEPRFEFVRLVVFGQALLGECQSKSITKIVNLRAAFAERLSLFSSTRIESCSFC